MAARELVVLGTAAQVPTRRRAHHGALLRWDREAILFDPGEGTQRQLILAGVPTSAITRICITHFHGDHCLGLPGVLQRLALDGVEHPIDLYYPSGGREFVARLRRASSHAREPEVREHAVYSDGVVDAGPAFTLHARALDHRIETYGWRIQEPDGRRMVPSELEARGVRGADVGTLQREGRVQIDGRCVGLEEVSVTRPGQSFACVMDTRWCDAAVELARRCDLLLCESTYLTSELALARSYGHLTAAHAGQIAAEAGARRLVLTHYSQRHTTEGPFAAEAGQFFGDVHASRDLDRVLVPPRTPVLAAEFVRE